jgi:putative transposase
MLEKTDMTHSMSRVGCCIDNGPIEALKYAIDIYITFYNHERYQETINGLSPLEYRGQAV